MTIVIRRAEARDIDQAQSVMNSTKTVKWLGGFTFRESLRGLVERQEKKGTADFLVAVDGDEVVGTCETNDKVSYKKMGLVAVSEDLRDVEYNESRELRRGIGTALYTAHAMLSAVSCKPTLVDHIHFENDVMRRFLKSHGFEEATVKRQNSRNLADLVVFEWDMADKGSDKWIETMLASINRGFDFSPLKDFVDLYEEKGRELLGRFEKSIHGEDANLLRLNQSNVVEVLKEF